MSRDADILRERLLTDSVAVLADSLARLRALLPGSGFSRIGGAASGHLRGRGIS